MKYRNEKTGAIINSPCIISGENWVKVEPEIKLEEVEKKETKKKSKKD